jgi:hypothetical protein
MGWFIAGPVPTPPPIGWEKAKFLVISNLQKVVD